VNDGSIKLEVNGKEVSGGTKCKPRKGYSCLESESSECHFKNLKIKELTSTHPPADEVSELMTRKSCHLATAGKFDVHANWLRQR